MDIRKFLICKRTADSGEESNNSKILKSSAEDEEVSKSEVAANSLCLAPKSGDLCITKYDIGLYVANKNISAELRHELLTQPYKPSKLYNFKNDTTAGDRAFRLCWLDQFSPWLVYSPNLKGALCLFCILFPQPVNRGNQGAFIVSAFTKYKNFHECAKNHVSTKWHKDSQINAENFLAVRRNPRSNILCQLDASIKNTIIENRQKLYSILSTIILCGTNDLALRGKCSSSGNVPDLLAFRIDAGDTTLKSHLETAPLNARYTSHRTQTELIALCEAEIRNEIINAANNSAGFSILADESADIAGKEQLSIGIRFVVHVQNSLEIREEFIGFTILEDMSANAIATSILNECIKFGLNLDKLLGQGYDGCSTMAGKENGVQAKVRELHPKAAFVHCSSHRLNLVVNDLNQVPQIRNTIGTIKTVIAFFRGSVLRRSRVPNIPLFCETRWTAKYKSIRIFFNNFTIIHQQLEELSKVGNTSTRQTAYQLWCSCNSVTFLFCLTIIAKYSSILEPVTQTLQSVNLNLHEVQRYINNLKDVLLKHRNEAETYFTNDIFNSVCILAESLSIDIILPRQCKIQHHRSNPGSTTVEDYFRQTIYIPYLDSIMSSLASRFSEENTPQFNLFLLSPARIENISRNEFKKHMLQIYEFYNFDNFESESMLWYDMITNGMQCGIKYESDFVDLLVRTELFPSIRQAILTLLSLPVTTCTIERSFSTLRRVKTWLRSTMSEDRLSGLCMLSIHRAKVNNEKSSFIERVIDKFGQNSRRLQFLFEQ